jgi:hypothetical protein
LSFNCQIIYACEIDQKGVIVCCASSTIGYHQFIFYTTDGQQSITLKSVFETSRGIPQYWVVFHNAVGFYTTNMDEVSQMITQTNINILIVSLDDSSSLATNQVLYLVSSNTTLVWLPLTIFSSALIVLPNNIDTYQMLVTISASILFDTCDRLWVLSSSIIPIYQTQMIRFYTKTTINNSFSSSPMINVANILPLSMFNNRINFLFDSNYLIYIDNQQNIYQLIRRQMCDRTYVFIDLRGMLDC